MTSDGVVSSVVKELVKLIPTKPEEESKPITQM